MQCSSGERHVPAHPCLVVPFALPDKARMLLHACLDKTLKCYEMRNDDETTNGLVEREVQDTSRAMSYLIGESAPHQVAAIRCAIGCWFLRVITLTVRLSDSDRLVAIQFYNQW